MGLLTLVLLVPTTTSTLPALADPTTSAPRSATLKSQADALRAQVEALRIQQSVAVEAYDTAVSDVETAISDEVRAQATLDAATGERRTTASDATRRVRSLYMGGTAGQLSTEVTSVLAAGDLDDLHTAAETARIARTVVADDTATVARAADAASAAEDAEASLTRVRAQKVAAQAAAETAREQVTASLARQQSLLDAADAAVVAAVAAEEEQARQEALAAAAARAAAAGVGDATSVADAVGAASSTAGGAVAAAWTRAGMDYVWGATGPTTFDCSGLTQWAYAQAGVSIPRTSRQQYAGLPEVPLDQLQPGDLVFYANGSSPSSIHHVALYLGGGRVLHAPHTGDVVREASVDMKGLFGAVRPTGL